jgi:NodT family efflux transporter outer membrane factor (OMF) lipoprotein
MQSIKNSGIAALLTVVMVLGMFLSACAPVGPEFVKPEINTPAHWYEQEVLGLAPTLPQLGQWWQVFQDPVLDDLVATARRNNNNLEIAGLRVLEARAQLGIAVGSLYPQSQIASGNSTYVSPPDNTGITSGDWQYNLGMSTGWEIDFWGRFRRGIESADAAYLSSIAAYDQAVVLLTALVTETYTAIRSTEEQLRIAYENTRIQQRSYDLTEVLYRNGDSPELDMQQALTLLLSTKATIPSLEIQLKQTKNAMSTLLGQTPGSVNSLLEGSKGIPVFPVDISVGFPADMLRRRPDVRQAELQAMAQNALVGVAQSNLYPRFSLIGSIGLMAGGPGDSNFGDLFDSNAFMYSFGPSFSWPFLNYGRLKNNVRVQDARLQQALVNYHETVLQAARETENAMAGFIGARQQVTILEKAVTSAKRSTKLSTLRYKEGFSEYQRVLDSQQSLFVQEQRYIVTQGNAVSNLIALYKALGGGWENRDKHLYLDQKTIETMQNRTDWGDLLESGSKQPDSADSRRKIDW